MNKNITAIALLFLTAIFFSPAKSLAITADVGASNLAQEAKIIVQGEVKSVKSYKGINDIIYTRASVLVSDVVKGKISKKNITVEYKSGEADDSGLFDEGTPSLEQGEQVLLFLTNSFWRKNVYYIVGGISGKYAICPDKTVRIGSSCDESDETSIDEETNQSSEETQNTETLNNISSEKQTLDELLSEIENTK